jgi:hypothetical protein
MQARIGELVDRMAFTPRTVEIVVTAAARESALRTEATATVLLGGGQNRSVLRTIER